MNVELTIQKCFDNFPGLFKERADVLNQLFCCNGNGFEWKNGELIDYECSETEIALLESHLVNGRAYQHNKLSLRAESIHYAIYRKEQEGVAIPEDPMTLFDDYTKSYWNGLPDDVYYEEPERRKRWYFYWNIPGYERIDFCEKYAFLFNYPDNIKPDWLAALEETKAMLIEDGYELPPRREPYENSVSLFNHRCG